MKDINVDIVIPIYNAYEYTECCIGSVIENTNLKKHRLILINDKSPDERILPLLNRIKNQYKELNIVVIDSKINNGFVKTVNIGMSYSDNDVVLLNSDTEVTDDWIEKLVDCAYSRPYIASVTPLSNNATLASVPNYLEDNILPNFLSLEEYAKEIEECSFKYYPEIPTGHGYCMYIRREAIKDVGLFDVVTFEKGYGEENDFSYRAIKQGYVHLLCDNTFIYHKGTQSFAKEKEAFILDHLQKLQKKHPENYANTDNYVKNYPTACIQNNIKYHINNKYRKNILFLVHDFRDIKKEKVLGGTTLHIYDLINNLKDKMNFHVLYPENGTMKLKSFFNDTEASINLGKVDTYNKLYMYNNQYKNILENVFNLINIDSIHIHHLFNQYLDIFNIAEEKNVPIIVTLHDFYTVCPTIQLLNNDKKYCLNEASCNCEICLKNLYNLEGNVIEKWRNEFYKNLKKAKKIIVPSTNTKEIMLKIYKDLNIDVIEHGVIKEEEILIENTSKYEKNIAFIGGINENKGLRILETMKNYINSNKSDIKLHVFGLTSEERLNKSDKNYIFHGPYERENLTKQLKDNNIKMICLFSIWPETYSYTLTEAVMSGIPVITLDIGAIASRIAENNCGWILNINSTPEQIIAKITEILKNEEDYNRKLQDVLKYKANIKDIVQMCNEYEDIYNNYSSKYERKISKDYIKMLLVNNDNSLNNSINEVEQLKQQLQEVQQKYIGVISSRRWKIFENNKILKFFAKFK